MDATHKISLWIENDEGLYFTARTCSSGDELEVQFLDILEMNPEFAKQILLDLLGPVDWDAIWERMQY